MSGRAGEALVMEVFNMLGETLKHPVVKQCGLSD